jgi:hypothetical protein
MKTVFMAFSFREEERPLVSSVDHLAASHYIKVVTGEDLGGEQLTPAVQRRIDQSDGLIALLTRRDERKAGGWTTHQWVQDELAYARTKGKRGIALIEEGVDAAGMYAPHEYIPLDRSKPLKAFVSLSETLGTWKWEAGRIVKVQILPTSLAEKVGRENGCKCRHRFVVEGKFSEWKEVSVVPEPGGAFVYLEGVRDDHMIQLVVEAEKTKWVSPAASQWMQIQLKMEKKKS